MTGLGDQTSKWPSN